MQKQSFAFDRPVPFVADPRAPVARVVHIGGGQ